MTTLPLGQATQYPEQYDPGLLYPIPRSENRLKLGLKEGQALLADQTLTVDPNVGGFGQTETEIVLQSPARVKGMIAFFFTIILAQILLVLKKKQFEKVQLAEMNF